MICACGNNRYFAHQILRADIIVDEDGRFDSNIDGSPSSVSIYDAEAPYGPFTCTKCKKEYEELN